MRTTEGYIMVLWEAADGYVGGRRPQRTSIPISELEGCETDDEIERAIEEHVQEDFVQNVVPEIDDIAEVIQAVRDAR